VADRIVLCLALLLASPARAEEKSPLEIRLEGGKRLRLGKRGYSGKLVVRFENRGDRPVTFHHEENNYLVFEGRGGKLDVICHPCACMLNHKESKEGARQFAVTLAPGGRKELPLVEWGCSGSYWRGPPAGSYRVTYRVFLERRTHTGRPNTCCDELRSAEFWKGALVSAPITLAIAGKR
jgi:hypothetical protein